MRSGHAICEYIIASLRLEKKSHAQRSFADSALERARRPSVRRVWTPGAPALLRCKLDRGVPAHFTVLGDAQAHRRTVMGGRAAARATRIRACRRGASQ